VREEASGKLWPAAVGRSGIDRDVGTPKTNLAQLPPKVLYKQRVGLQYQEPSAPEFASTTSPLFVLSFPKGTHHRKHQRIVYSMARGRDAAVAVNTEVRRGQDHHSFSCRNQHVRSHRKEPMLALGLHFKRISSTSAHPTPTAY
jgi:hypothetical protein